MALLSFFPGEFYILPMALRKGRQVERSWEFGQRVLERVGAARGAERACEALDEILMESFALDRAVLFWKGSGHKTLKKIPFHLTLDIDTQTAEEYLNYCREKGCGNLEINDLNTPFVYNISPSGLELAFFYVGAGEIPVGQLQMVLGIWSLRWEKVQADREALRIGQQLARIRAISEELGRVQEYKPLLSRILKMTISLVDAERGFVMIVNETTGKLRTEVAHGMPNPRADALIYEGKIPMAEIPAGMGIQGKVFETGQPIMVDQLTDFSVLGLDRDTHSIICVPLLMNGESFGVIYVTNKKDAVRFASQDMDLVSILAGNVASVIDQVRKFKMTVTDHLTGIYTRRFFDDRLEHEVRRALRYKTLVSLLALDVDHFKSINDGYGHFAGDLALKAISEVLRKSIRTEVDIPARIGGEEFCVLLPETSLAGAKVVAERIRAAVEALQLEVDGHRIPMTISVGCITCPDHAEDALTLLRLADNALYYSKDQGRNRVTLWPDMPKRP